MAELVADLDGALALLDVGGRFGRGPGSPRCWWPFWTGILATKVGGRFGRGFWPKSGSLALALAEVVVAALVTDLVAVLVAAPKKC